MHPYLTDADIGEVKVFAGDALAEGLDALGQLLTALDTINDADRDATLAWLREHEFAIHAIGVKVHDGAPTWAGVIIHTGIIGYAAFSWGEIGRFGSRGVAECMHSIGEIIMRTASHDRPLTDRYAPEYLEGCECHSQAALDFDDAAWVDERYAQDEY
jgi:hypothetical protein